MEPHRPADVVALLTPYDGGGGVDEAAMRAHVDWLVAAGIDGLMPCGTTGEGALLAGDEGAAGGGAGGGGGRGGGPRGGRGARGARAGPRPHRAAGDGADGRARAPRGGGRSGGGGRDRAV